MNNTITSQLTAIVAEVAITTLGGIALSCGLDGAILGTCIAALAGLGGYQLNRAGKNSGNFASPHNKPPPPPTE
jgi:hypothetical protein